MNTDDEIMETVGRKFLRKYWKMNVVFAVLIVAALAEALLVFLWVLADLQTLGLIQTTLGLLSVGQIITLILHLLFWEIILVGIWIIVAAALVYTKWYNNLPEEDKFPKRERGRRDEGDAFGFLIGITWLIIIWFTNRWDVTFNAWTVNDWVFTWLLAVLIDLLIIGIPVLLYFIYWIRKEP
jgi:hypothetical protein